MTLYTYLYVASWDYVRGQLDHSYLAADLRTAMYTPPISPV